MHFTHALFSLLPLLAVATPVDLALRDDSPPSDSVKISGSPQTSGSGCPQGTVSTSISDDRSTVTFGFDAFQAYIGPSKSFRPPSRAENSSAGVGPCKVARHYALLVPYVETRDLG